MEVTPDIGRKWNCIAIQECPRNKWKHKEMIDLSKATEQFRAVLEINSLRS